jgi:hypothetical protein
MLRAVRIAKSGNPRRKPTRQQNENAAEGNIHIIK